MASDSFGDFKTAGYLRNTQGLSDPASIKHVEHALFPTNLDDAIEMLRTRKVIDYGPSSACGLFKDA